MKFGVRRPSLRKRIAARTSWKRVVRNNLGLAYAAAGDLVKETQIVGLVGATGRVTGAHLHWTVRVAGARVDPLGVLAVLSRAPK